MKGKAHCPSLHPLIPTEPVSLHCSALIMVAIPPCLHDPKTRSLQLHRLRKQGQQVTWVFFLHIHLAFYQAYKIILSFFYFISLYFNTNHLGTVIETHTFDLLSLFCLLFSTLFLLVGHSSSGYSVILWFLFLCYWIVTLVKACLMKIQFPALELRGNLLNAPKFVCLLLI